MNSFILSYFYFLNNPFANNCPIESLPSPYSYKNYNQQPAKLFIAKCSGHFYCNISQEGVVRRFLQLPSIDTVFHECYVEFRNHFDERTANGYEKNHLSVYASVVS